MKIPQYEDWENWAGTVHCSPQEIFRPHHLNELVDYVGKNGPAGRNIRVIGSGHSYNDIAITEYLMISLENMQGIIDYDLATSQATVWAGTPIHTLTQELDKIGLALLNQGDIDEQTIAGAISTGTHGTGITLGCLATQVIGMTLLTADGMLHELPDEDPDLFRAAQISLGTLGIIVKVKLQLCPTFMLNLTTKNESRSEVLANIDTLIHTNKYYEFWAWPYTDRLSTRVWNPTTEALNDPTWLESFQTDFIENTVFGIASQIGRIFPFTCKWISQMSAKLDSESTRINKSFKVLSTRRRVTLTEIEYAVPAERGPDCLLEVMDLIEREKVPVNFPLEYRYVAADDIMLSPFYQRASALVDVQMFKDKNLHWDARYKPFFVACEEIFRRYDGRPHWGKMHYLQGRDLKPLYPAWDTFQDIRREVDPNGIFMNDYTRRVFSE